MRGLQAKRLGLNLLLLVLVVGLALAALWWQQQQATQDPAQRLLRLSAAEVTRLEIERNPAAPGQDVLLFQRSELGAEQRWSLLKPVQVTANALRVRQLLTLLDDKVEASYPAQERDLQPYGLAPGQLQVRFNGETLILGTLNPVSNRRYVLYANTIYLVNEAVFGSMSGSWVDFVALKLIPEGSLEAVQLAEPPANPAELVTAWQQAEAIRVELLAPDFTPSPQALVRLSSAGKQRELWLDRSVSTELVLADPALGVRYILPLSQMASLFPPKP